LSREPSSDQSHNNPGDKSHVRHLFFPSLSVDRPLPARPFLERALPIVNLAAYTGVPEIH
jgi:hypothetical protein